MTVVLYVEGDTEETALRAFFSRWMDQRGCSGVGIKAVNFKGVGNYLREFVKRAKRDLNAGSVKGIIGLIDLYRSGLQYPDGSLNEKYSWAKTKLETKIDDQRFQQHFAVHEAEAWLLSGDNIFPPEVAIRLPKTPPEGINFLNPPSHRLQTLYSRHLDRNYNKVIDGVNPIPEAEA